MTVSPLVGCIRQNGRIRESEKLVLRYSEQGMDIFALQHNMNSIHLNLH